MKLYDGMLCPICEIGYLKEETNYTYKTFIEPLDKEIVVENCKIFNCTVCVDGLYDKESEGRIDQEIMMLRRKGNNV